MSIHKPLLFVTGLAALFAAAGYTQNAKEPNTVRDYCIKAVPGKNAEATAFLHDVAVPIYQARANAGEFDWEVIASAVVPAGESARCDFRLTYGYHGFFPTVNSEEKVQAELKRAGLNTNMQEVIAKRDSLTRLVAKEYWVNMDGTGTGMQKGNFVRLNHYKVKPDAGQEWFRLETTYWKPMVDSWIKGGNKGDWAVYRLWMPNGENQPYNAMTIDIFSDWNSMAHGLPLNDLWPKVHPGTDMTGIFDQLERVRSRYNTEIYKVTEIVEPNGINSK